MKLHTRKTATYLWIVYHDDLEVGRVWMESVNWVGPKWGCGVSTAINGLDKDRLRHALYRLMREIQGATGNRKKCVVFRSEVDLDSDLETIRKKVFTWQIAAR